MLKDLHMKPDAGLSLRRVCG